MGFLLTMTRSFTDSLEGHRKTGGVGGCAVKGMTRVLNRYESVYMQVVLYPWVHESSLIKCQPVISIFYSPFGLLCPYIIDVTGQF